MSIRSIDMNCLSVPEKPSVGDGSYFSLGNEKSVIEMPALPAWMINTPMHSKLPIISVPKGKFVLFTTGLCDKLHCTPSDLDFDSSPQSISVQYKSLHDPHLRWHYNRVAVYKRLIRNGFITSDGKVKCTLREFNDYHQYLKEIRLAKLKYDRKCMMEKEQKEKLRKEIKSKEQLNIREIRSMEAKERKKKQEADKEARLGEMLRIETMRYIRLDEKLHLKHKLNKTRMNIAQDKRRTLKVQQAREERQRHAALLRNRTAEDNTRAELLDRNRRTQREEREAKLEQKWVLRERLREMRQLCDISQKETRRLIMASNIADRDAYVEQQRTRQQAIFNEIQGKRAQQMKEKEQRFANRLDMKLKKVHERFEKRKRSHQRSTRSTETNSSRRSRFSSTWTLETTLTSPDMTFPSDNSWIHKLKIAEATKTKNLAEKTCDLDADIGEVHRNDEILWHRESSASSVFNSRKSVRYVTYDEMLETIESCPINDSTEDIKSVISTPSNITGMDKYPSLQREEGDM